MNKIGVIGLGYVGLPVAVAFSGVAQVVGYDRDRSRIAELKRGYDRTSEVSNERLSSATGLFLTDDLEDIRECSVYIVCVPTPIDDARRPDLHALQDASRDIGRALSVGDLVVYESTVYPGATEEVCIPLLEAQSGLKLNEDFGVGYSPERINPGDHDRRFENTVKVVSGSSPEVLSRVATLYDSVVAAGTYRVSSLRVAEAAKVIENTQRDLNIALINELAQIFSLGNIDTQEVLEAAATKWNFMAFTPGLVGGHCIGVDPYYLTFKAEQLGHTPKVILAGREVNDGVVGHVVSRVLDLVAGAGRAAQGSRILVFGATFKENCPDIRNSGALALSKALVQAGYEVSIVDPWVAYDDRLVGKGILWEDLETFLAEPAERFAAAVIAVGHQQFIDVAERIRNSLGLSCPIFDVKSAFPRHLVTARL